MTKRGGLGSDRGDPPLLLVSSAAHGLRDQSLAACLDLPTRGLRRRTPLTDGLRHDSGLLADPIQRGLAGGQFWPRRIMPAQFWGYSVFQPSRTLGAELRCFCLWGQPQMGLGLDSFPRTILQTAASTFSWPTPLSQT